MPKFQEGDQVVRAELEPFELDFLVPKVRLATGHVKQVLLYTGPSRKRSDGYKYEVLWTWDDGETCLAHYHGYQLDPYDPKQ